MKQTKVLILLPSFAGGGAERTIMNLMNFEHDRNLEIKVLLISKEGPYLEQIDSKNLIAYSSNFFQLSLIQQTYFFLFRYLPECIKCIRSYKPDCIMTVTESMNYLGYFFRKFGITRNSTWVVRSGNNIFSEARSKGPILGSFLLFLLRKTYHKADQIVTISEGIKKAILSKFSIRDQNITTIYNPIDLQRIIRLKEEHIDHHTDYILGIGRLAEQKRFDILIEAFSKVFSGTSVDLIILGQGSELNNLKKLANNLGIEDQVHFMGFQQNPYKYLKHAEAFVLSSSWEGFAHVVGEALACKAHVISTNCDFGPAEILQEGKFGKLFQPENIDQLTQHLSNIFNDQKQINSSLLTERARDFDISRIIPQYLDLFEKTSLSNEA